jgi:hypothetical protein
VLPDGAGISRKLPDQDSVKPNTDTFAVMPIFQYKIGRAKGLGYSPSDMVAQGQLPAGGDMLHCLMSCPLKCSAQTGTPLEKEMSCFAFP